MINGFIRYLETERRFSPLTLRNYRADMERFVGWMTAGTMEFEPGDITVERIRDWILVRSDRDRVSAASMNRELSTLRSWCRWMVRTGGMQKDITRGIHSLKSSKHLPAFVPESRMRDIVERCDEASPADGTKDSFCAERDALMVLMFYTCGLRLAELVAVDRDDFAADFSSLRVHGKGNKERVVPVLEFVREKILDHLSRIEGQNICKIEEKALFLTLKGRRISRSVVQRAVRAALVEAEVQGKKSPHVLRHTFATHLMNGGADMRDIQELMGHASLQATQIYTHNSIARLQEVYRNAHPRTRDGE